jgi:hypothetical protein
LALIFSKYYSFFDEKNDKEIHTLLVKSLQYIIPIIEKNGNDEFLYGFIFKVEYIEVFAKNLSWREVSGLLVLLKDSNLFVNKDFLEKMLVIGNKFITYENYQISSNAVKLLAKVYKYSKKQEREKIFLQFEKDLLESTSHYQRRLFMDFISECFDLFSFSYIKESKLFEMYLSMFSDNSMTSRVLEILPKIYPLLDRDSKLSVSKAIDTIKASSSNISELNNFERWQNSFIKDPNSSKKILEHDKFKYSDEEKQNAADIGI